MITQTFRVTRVLAGHSPIARIDGVDDEDGLDAEIRQAEKEAAKLLDGLTRASAKREFDKRVHGKG